MPNASQTEPGTPRRHEKAREEGQIARSRDLPGAAAILAAIAGLTFVTHGGVEPWRKLWSQLLDQAIQPDAQIGILQFRSTWATALSWTAPVIGGAWLAGAAVSMQGGVVFSVPALFRFSRLKPGSNLKNLFSAAGLSRTLRSILPAAVIVYLTYAEVSDAWSPMMHGAGMPVRMGLAWLVKLILALCWKGGGVLLVWSAIDYFLQRRTFENSLKMSRQEIKDEGKQTQGNPEVRGRIKKIQRQMHRRRMMRDVPKATVVITNPTSYAIALRYDPATMAAPVVVAKGRRFLAGAIRRLAVWHGVPIVENVPLAHALYRNVEIGHPIPGQLYAAVAEIMAFIFRAQARRPAPAPPLPSTPRSF